MTVPSAGAAADRQVPSFDAHVYQPKRADYCVCAFVINENGKLVAAVFQIGYQLHLALIGIPAKVVKIKSQH